MLSVLQESFWERLAGVATLQRAVYEAIRQDTEASSQSWWIVVLLGLANGIALIVTPLATAIPGMPSEMASDANELVAAFTFETTGQQIAGLVAGIVGAIISWYLSSWLLRVIGNRMAGQTGQRVSADEMRRLVAWGYSPSLASFLTPIPVIGPLLATVGTLWAFVTGVMAVRTAFGVGIGKAIAIEIVAFLAVLLVAIVVVLIALMIAAPLL